MRPVFLSLATLTPAPSAPEPVRRFRAYVRWTARELTHVAAASMHGEHNRFVTGVGRVALDAIRSRGTDMRAFEAAALALIAAECATTRYRPTCPTFEARARGALVLARDVYTGGVPPQVVVAAHKMFGTPVRAARLERIAPPSHAGGVHAL